MPSPEPLRRFRSTPQPADGRKFESRSPRLADAIVKIGGVSAEEQAKMASAGKEMVFAEHDKVKQFEKILAIIKEKAVAAL